MNLERLDHATPRFLDLMKSMSVQTRKLLSGFADCSEPASARDVGEASRLAVNTASMVLGRLVIDGIVLASGSPRRRRYQFADPEFRAWLRCRSSPALARDLADAQGIPVLRGAA